MNPNEINKRIAIYRAQKSPHDWAWNGGDPSNYHGDLNAMHEAEKSLSFEQRDSFMERLYELTIEESKHEHTWGMTHATAAQRAEAFLRTIGQWEDDK